jgi:hypothetical protein
MTESAFTEDGGGDWKGERIEVLVEVRRISAWIEGKKPHIAVRAVVEGEWTMTFYREGGTNSVRGYTYACVKASGGRGEDAKRIVALVKVLTGEVPNINHLTSSPP